MHVLPDWLKSCFNRSGVPSRLDFCAFWSSVWNFYAHSSELISRGYYWWRHEMGLLSHAMLLCNSIHFTLKTLFWNTKDWCPKTTPLTNSAPFFAMKTMIIFMGVYPTTHTLPLTALTDSPFLFSSFQNHLKDIMQKICESWSPFQKRKLGERVWFILGCNIAGFSFFCSF